MEIAIAKCLNCGREILLGGKCCGDSNLRFTGKYEYYSKPKKMFDYWDSLSELRQAGKLDVGTSFNISH